MTQLKPRKNETRSRKVSEARRTQLEFEIYQSTAPDDTQAGRVTKVNWNRRLTSGPIPVEQGHDFATSTGTLDREELSELSNF